MELTELLRRVQSGEREALDVVVPLVYGELKKLAAAHLSHKGRPEPLQTTELVHETFLRLAGSRHHPEYESRAHFYGVASRLMRQILVDAARARTAQKRHGGAEVPLADIPDLGRQSDANLLAMDEALEHLARTAPLKVQIIEMRYFAGMTAEESAEVLSIPVHTVRRDLRLAHAWLRREMAR